MKKIDMNQIGERIRVSREKKNESRDELAERLGVTARHLAGVENGSKGMSLGLFYDIKEELGTSADYLFDGDIVMESSDERRRYLEQEILTCLRRCSVSQLETVEEMTRLLTRSLIEESSRKR